MSLCKGSNLTLIVKGKQNFICKYLLDIFSL